MRKIRLAYRIIIDNSSNFLWDKYVFEDTYKEYLLQHQLFNNKDNPLHTYRELLTHNEKAEQLNFLISTAAQGYVDQLKNNFHRVTDVLGNNFFPFTNFKLDIINTDITDINKHKIGITFFSPPLILIDTINNCYLISLDIEKDNNFQTLMFPFQPNLSICYIQNN